MCSNGSGPPSGCTNRNVFTSCVSSKIRAIASSPDQNVFFALRLRRASFFVARTQRAGRVVRAMRTRAAIAEHDANAIGSDVGS